jgi:hypothetical protein
MDMTTLAFAAARTHSRAPYVAGLPNKAAQGKGGEKRKRGAPAKAGSAGFLRNFPPPSFIFFSESTPPPPCLCVYVCVCACVCVCLCALSLARSLARSLSRSLSLSLARALSGLNHKP